MSSEKKKLFLLFLIGSLAGIFGMFIYQKFNDQNAAEPQTDISSSTSSSLAELTEEHAVISFVKANQKLPDFYITKKEARKQGWNASEKNLCALLPGKAIGGDAFGNREKLLPQDDTYFEADVNVTCKSRGAERIIFTKKGNVWLTKDHYKSFIKK